MSKSITTRTLRVRFLSTQPNTKKTHTCIVLKFVHLFKNKIKQNTTKLEVGESLLKQIMLHTNLLHHTEHTIPS